MTGRRMPVRLIATARAPIAFTHRILREPAMKFTASTPRQALAVRPLHASGAIEWEELPSFADSLNQRLGAAGERRVAD